MTSEYNCNWRDSRIVTGVSIIILMIKNDRLFLLIESASGIYRGLQVGLQL